MKSFVRSLAVGGCFVVTRFIGRLIGTPLIGASFAHLSLGAAVAPLAGFYGGTVGALGAGFFTLFIVTALHGSFSIAYLALYLPGIIGGLFFTHSSYKNSLRMVKSLFFIVFMVLFWLHPVGQQAFLYPFLWLVPLMLLLINQQSLFARAFVSAFAVHAVGACWWLYTMPMAPSLWHGMMPLVVVERLVQSLLMIVIVNVVEKVSNLAKVRQVAARVSLQ